MEQEYRISTWYKFFYGTIAVVLFLFSIWMFNVKNESVSSLVLLIPLFLIVISILIIINITKRKVVIDENSILCVNLFSTKELRLNEIKGYRLDGKGVKIEPISENNPVLYIGNYLDFKNHSEISAWAKNNFKDLDAIDFQAEYQKLLKDTTLGTSEKEREGKLKKAREIAATYNVLSGVLSFFMVFFDGKISCIILLVLPLIGIALFYNFKLIKFISNSKRSIYRFVFFGFLVPSFILLLKSSEFNLLNFDGVWLPIGGVSFGMFALLCFKGINKSVGSVKVQVILMLFCSIFYGFGSVKTINCMFDQSEQLVFKATVIGHHVYHGKHTTYYLKLSPWGPQQEEKDYSVPKKMYHKTKIEDVVDVKYKEGFLKAPWFIITPHNK